MSRDMRLVAEIEKLFALYEYNWGKKIDDIDQLSVMGYVHEGIMVEILEDIVETGDSLLVGYGKWKQKQHRLL